MLQDDYRDKNGKVLWENGEMKKRQGLLQKKARYFAYQYKKDWQAHKLRLSEHNFEEKFWEEALRIITETYTWDTDYYLYETLERAFGKRAYDVV